MKTLAIQIPDSVELSEAELTLMTAARLYENATLSIGEAAEMCGISKEEMMGKLGDYGVAFFDYPASDLKMEMENAKYYHR